ATRIVKVTAREPLTRHRERLREELLHHCRIGVANGVRQADAIHADVEDGLDQPQHFGRFDAALDRAAEGRAEADLEETPRTGSVTCGANARDLLHDVVGRLAQVGAAVRMACRPGY